MITARDPKTGRIIATVKNRICESKTCKKEFFPKRRAQRFCSHSCATSSYPDFVRKGESRICRQCGNSFYATKSAAKRGVSFCSAKCLGIFRAGFERVWVETDAGLECRIGRNGERVIVCKCHFEQIKDLVVSFGLRGYPLVAFNGKMIPIHRVILRLNAGEIGDHINRNRLDNRCLNLRKATNTQNAANAGRSSANRSGYRGVSREKGTGKWIARLQKRSEGSRRTILYGRFDSAIDAAKAWDVKMREEFGEYAFQNFP